MYATDWVAAGMFVGPVAAAALTGLAVLLTAREHKPVPLKVRRRHR